jgi:hypothetical protein
MNEFDEVVRRTREEFEPSRRDRERVKHRLASKLAGAAFTASLATGATKAAHAGSLLAGQSLAALSKLFFGSMLVTFASVGAIVTVARGLGEPSRGPATVAAKLPARSTGAPTRNTIVPTPGAVVMPAPVMASAIPALASAVPALASAVATVASATRKDEHPATNPQIPSTATLTTLSSAAPPSSGSMLDAELADLREVRRANAEHDTARAERLLDALDQRYPHGLLMEERAALRAITSCESGAAGAERAGDFVTRYPASIYGAKVRRACGLDGVERTAPDTQAPFTDSPRPGH